MEHIDFDGDISDDADAADFEHHERTLIIKYTLNCFYHLCKMYKNKVLP